MIGNSLLTQIGIAGVAIGIIITYIQPTLGEIKETQGKIDQTKVERINIDEINKKLLSLYGQMNSILPSDKVALFTYLPDRVDEVRVLKDLTSIARDSSLIVKNLAHTGSKKSSEVSQSNDEGTVDEASQDLFVHEFGISFLSSYEQMKDFLLRLEQNNYPLEISSLSIMPTEGGFLETNANIITYSHKE